MAAAGAAAAAAAAAAAGADDGLCSSSWEGFLFGKGVTLAGAGLVLFKTGAFFGVVVTFFGGSGVLMIGFLFGAGSGAASSTSSSSSSSAGVLTPPRPLPPPLPAPSSGTGVIGATVPPN